MKNSKYNSKPFFINYKWDNAAQDRLWLYLNKQEKKNTHQVIDNELMAMDLLETLVDDSANRDAITMLNSIGIRC